MVDFGVVSPLHVTEVDESKIQNGGQTFRLAEDGKWGVWFSNGMREFTSSIFETDIIQDELSLFPNPVTELLSIQITTDKQRIESIDIFDITGRKVVNKAYGNSKTNVAEISVAHLSAGLYNIVCRSSDKVFASQFVKGD